MYTVWYSTESMADYIIDNTVLAKEKSLKNVRKKLMLESDLRKNKKAKVNFADVPEHIRKVLYLDAPDIIVEQDNEPIFSIEVSTEAGTGHNVFQRFARIAAAVENEVPAIYIYPEASIVKREDKSKSRTKYKYKWDSLNPLVFSALDDLMNIFGVPALLFYYPSEYRNWLQNNQPVVTSSDYNKHTGLVVEKRRKYAGCPDSSDDDMQSMFEILDEILLKTKSDAVTGRKNILSSLKVRNHRKKMGARLFEHAGDKPLDQMSPLSAIVEVPSDYVLNYLKQYESKSYKIGELLGDGRRKNAIIYSVGTKDFREDPYCGCITAIDYIKCREGKTFEDRVNSLILAFGEIKVDDTKRTITIVPGSNGSPSISEFEKSIMKSVKNNLLVKSISTLKPEEIPRYYMQARSGLLYSRPKTIRIFSFFADAILFTDGTLWRDA